MAIPSIHDGILFCKFIAMNLFRKRKKCDMFLPEWLELTRNGTRYAFLLDHNLSIKCDRSFLINKRVLYRYPETPLKAIKPRICSRDSPRM